MTVMVIQKNGAPESNPHSCRKNIMKLIIIRLVRSQLVAKKPAITCKSLYS